MSIAELVLDIQVSLNKPLYHRERTLDDWLRIKQLASSMPSNEVRLTEEKIEKAFYQYENGLPSGEPKREVAFFIQPRGSYKQPDALYGDITDYLPALDSRYGVTPAERHKLFYQLPPFEVTKYKYSYGDCSGAGSVVCVPLSVDDMNDALQRGRSDSERRKNIGLYAQPKIFDAVEFARDRLGATNIGLGETMASMTYFGRKIESRIKGVNVTTGHAGTTWLIDNTVLKAAGLGEVNLPDEVIGIIGSGSIGTAAARNLDGRVKGFVLSDINPNSSHRLEKQLKEDFPGIQVEIAGNNEDLCAKSKFIIGAGSNLAPILSRHSIQPGTIIVDDSQPVTALREEVEAAGGVIVWPLAMMPQYLKREAYNFGKKGVLQATAWGCEAEVWTLYLTGQMQNGRVNHRVESEDVQRVGKLAKQVGFEVSEPLQSFGRPITDEQWERIRQTRQ